MAGSLTPEQRTLRARLAATTRWANQSPADALDKLRRGLESKWLDQVDPDRTLPEPERLRRAEAARLAHLYRASLASARARRERRQAQDG